MRWKGAGVNKPNQIDFTLLNKRFRIAQSRYIYPEADYEGDHI